MISFFVWVWMCAPSIFLSCATNTFACHTQKSHSFFLSFIAVLFGENEMSMVFFSSHTFAKLWAPLCMTVHKMLFIRYSFALYPILCLFCHTNCLLEKPLKKFSSGTLERQNFHAFLLGMKKISLLWFWVWLDRIDACICRNRNEWWCNTVERIEMRLFIHKLYWHWRTSHSKSCIYPSDNDVAIIHVEAK